MQPAVKGGLPAAAYTQVSYVGDEINGLLACGRSRLKADAESVRGIKCELPADGEPETVRESYRRLSPA